MAKPKQSILVKTYGGNGINVWVDDPSQVIGDILEVEGVSLAMLGNGSNIIVWIDPRYDKEEVADQIRVLLSSEVPKIFKE